MPIVASFTSDSVTASLGPSARRGFALLAATSDSLPGFVGAQMRCFSCHLDNGRRPNAMPLVGSYARLPKYQARSGHTINIQERVNACFTRSLAGRAIPTDGRDMTDIVAYLRFISTGAAAAHIVGLGLPVMPSVPVTDSAHGRVVYAARCARCHGANGGGGGIPQAPPLWGARSFSIGASLARRDRAASFIRYNMPYDSAGTIDDRTAFDVAAYVLSHARPDSRGKDNDWPNGDAPRDVPYSTRSHTAFNPPPLLPPAHRRERRREHHG
ncbi:MAG: c-type cytochrome [Gemmatimonadaceae bacterium]